MQEVNFSSHAYCKMMLHAAKYPQCAVNGVLLASNDQNDGRSQSVAYVDAIPLFHLCLNVSPMAEIALSQVRQHIYLNLSCYKLELILNIFVFRSNRGLVLMDLLSQVTIQLMKIYMIPGNCGVTPEVYYCTVDVDYQMN